jgi:hypothetical protein
LSLHKSQLKRLAAAGGFAALLIAATSAPSAAQVWAAPDAAVRFDVKPKQTQVYVDGFYTGIVDDYNDWYERLYTAPGPHEITLFLDGYRTHTQRAYLTPDHTFKVKFQMEKLPAGETAELPPPPPPPPPPDEQGQGLRRTYGRRGQPPSPGAPPDTSPAGAPPPSAERARGTLELHLQPADAEVLVDGQSWPRSGADRVTIDLSDGEHNVQVRKSGYVGYLTDVQIRPGETATLDIALRAETPR